MQFFPAGFTGKIGPTRNGAFVPDQLVFKIKVIGGVIFSLSSHQVVCCVIGKTNQIIAIAAILETNRTESVPGIVNQIDLIVHGGELSIPTVTVGGHGFTVYFDRFQSGFRIPVI